MVHRNVQRLDLLVQRHNVLDVRTQEEVPVLEVQNTTESEGFQIFVKMHKNTTQISRENFTLSNVFRS